MLETEGLPNCGNTCYFNSFLQMFFNIIEIQDYFKDYSLIDDKSESEYDKKLILILNGFKKIYNIIFNINKNNYNYINIIKNLIRNIFRKSNGTTIDVKQQQDSSEVYTIICGKFNSENITNTKLIEFSNLLKILFNNKSIETKTYNREIENLVCNDKFEDKEEIKNIIQIHKNKILNNKNFIKIILETEVEQIDGFKCQDPSFIFKQFIKKSNNELISKYLILNFIPYDSNDVFKYGEVELDKKFVSKNNLNYKIKGIIIHTGELNAGHYVYYHFEDDKCKIYDDSSISRCNLKERNNKYIFDDKKHPVLIIYEKYETNINKLQNLINNHFDKLNLK